jgi:hypothetical protein
MVYLKKVKGHWYLYHSIRIGDKITKKYIGRANFFQYIYYKHIRPKWRST